ncbi:MAG: Na(+)/H(+) antiporter subunit D [Nitrospira sp.]|nr:Na(+)/H(+) antiporter subunit D [Candidatus Manganitrophaceae bacterium]HIL34252.1 Na(+)/H(+) antiporter subunit D [Candidatus Manganitrophaceae bacterium]
MIEWIHPALIFFAAAAILPFVKGKWKSILLIGFPALAFFSLMFFPDGSYGVFTIGGFEVVFGRVDKLSRVFAYVFTLMGSVGMVYALHVKQKGQHMASLIYGGGALGSVFSGDLLSLFVFWEIMAFSSVFLVWYGGAKSWTPGLRYLLIHTFGGVCLLGGIVIFAGQTGSIAFNAIPASGLGGWFILIGFLINAGAPPLHAWLPDAYPEGSITGTIFLSSFTTKTAVYVLARGFAGTEVLMWVGVIMALYGVVYAMLENNVRRLLAYHIISQVGFMVAGIGVGTELAINGAVAHAFAHILYKALLMMGMGSVIFMTGRRKGTELGGLYRTMPLTFGLFMIGGFSISGVPFLSGFISKSMVISGAAAAHYPFVVLLLTLAAAGTFLSTTLKLPYAVFMGEDRGIKADDPPGNMLLGMGLAAFICILLGVFPNLLYQLLPFSVDYHPYTAEHLVGSFQLLLATLLGFILFLYKLHPENTISVDTDWVYRRGVAYFRRLPNPFQGIKVVQYRDILQGLTEFSQHVARRFQSGYLKHYLVMIISFVMLSTLLFSLFKGWALSLDSLMQTDLTLAQLLIFVLIISSTLSTVFFKNRISAVLSLGMTGFFVAFFYVLMGAPDLALTQYLVEAISVILILLAFYFLPAYFEEKTASAAKITDIAVSLLVGIVMTFYMLMVMDSHLTESIASYYLEMSEKLAGGRNVVNVVIVDFRGFDTMFEIAVFSIAALGIFGMLKLNKKKMSIQKKGASNGSLKLEKSGESVQQEVASK